MKRRLTNSNMGSSCTGGKSVSYDSIGNITDKSDTGSYSYGGAGPHAVTSITGTVDGLTNPHYSYDDNGNLTCVSTGSGCSGTIGRTVISTSFNMAGAILQGTNSLNLTYDDQHQRIEQVSTVSDTTTTTTVYLNDPASGAMSEQVTNSGTTPTDWGSFNWGGAPWGGVTADAVPTWVDYIQVDGQIVAQRSVKYQNGALWGFSTWGSFSWGTPNPGSNWGSFNWGSGTWTGPVVVWEYFTLDHLNSVAVVTDQGGNVLQRLSYDPWGKQRNPNGTDAACGTITSDTTRGFTNQEQMPTACLVNLNARLYDPSIGRFMSADSVVPNPYNAQSFNRFSYVNNNPLSFTDTTGHDFDDEDLTGCSGTEECQCAGSCYGIGDNGLAEEYNSLAAQDTQLNAFANALSSQSQSGLNNGNPEGTVVSPSGLIGSVGDASSISNQLSETGPSVVASNSNPDQAYVYGGVVQMQAYGAEGGYGSPTLYTPWSPLTTSTQDQATLDFLNDPSSYYLLSPPDSIELPPVVITATNGGWFNPTSTLVGGVEVLSDVTKYSAGASTLGINLNNIFKSKIYTSGWSTGNGSVKILGGVASGAEMFGRLSLTAGIGLDIYGYGTGQISGSKLGVDLTVDAIGVFGGPPGAVIAGTYYGLETFYPGGTAGFVSDFNKDAKQNDFDTNPVPLGPGEL